MKPLSKKDHANLWSTVDSEGLDYYLLDYGPDLDQIERLGFDRKKVEEMLELLRSLRDKIDEGQDFYDEE